MSAIAAFKRAMKNAYPTCALCDHPSVIEFKFQWHPSQWACRDHYLDVCDDLLTHRLYNHEVYDHESCEYL